MLGPPTGPKAGDWVLAKIEVFPSTLACTLVDLRFSAREILRVFRDEVPRIADAQ